MNAKLGYWLYRAYSIPLKNHRLCLILLAGLVACFVLAEMAEVLMKEEIYNGYDNTVSRMIIPHCSWADAPYNRGQVNWYLVCASYLSFGNARIIPSVISFGMIPMCFLLARKMSNNLVALLVSLGLAFTPTFFIFDTSAAFAQTWSLLFLGSLYFARKKPYLSIPFFVGSLFAKTIPIIWLPAIIYFIISSSHTKHEKITTVAILAGIVGLLAAYMLYLGIVITIPPTDGSIQNGLVVTWESFRWSEIILLVLPFVISFHMIFQKRFNLKPEGAILAIYSVGSIFFISAFTTGGYFPYRIIPNLIIILYYYASLFHDVVYPKLEKYHMVVQ